MSESEYKELVLAAFEQKLATGQLAAELLSPTPGRVKAESVRICEQRFSAADVKILRSFFDDKDGKAGYLNAVKNCNAEIFKPVITFFSDKKLTSNLRNAEYLAWLLDFPARPYHPDLKVPKGFFKDKLPTETIEESPENRNGQVKNRRSWVLMIAGLVLMVGLGAYIIIKVPAEYYRGHEGCMIWSDDHYEPADCSDKSPDKILLPMDHQVLEHFKRITDTKTLTLADVGKTWYAKHNGNVEFFTDSGVYPLDTNLRVLPMSVHILQKYVYHTVN